MPTFFNFNKRKGVFMIPAGATKSPSGNGFPNTKSLSFDGVDEYVKTPDNYTLLDGLENFAFSFWIKPTDSGVNRMILSIGTASADTRASQFQIYKTTTDRIFLYMAGLSYSGSTNDNAIAQDQWTHVLVTRDDGRAANLKLKFFINGVENTLFDSTRFASPSNANTGLWIGEHQGGFQNPFLGNIDEVAIYNQDMAAYIDEIYASGTVADLNNLDTAPAPNTWFRNGDNSTFKSPQILMPENTNKDKVSNYSLAFDGVDDFIGIGTTSLGITSAITVSTWVKIPTTNTGGASPNIQIIAAEDSTGGADRNWLLFWRHLSVSDKNFYFTLFHTDGSFSSIQSTGIVPNDGNWHHIMGTFDGTTDANGLKLYVDGTLFQTTAGSTGIRSTSGVAPSIGANEFGTAWRFEGNIDEVAVWDSVQDVSSIYNSGTPTTISGATAYWKLGEQATFSTNWTVPDQVGSNDGTSANMTIEDRVGDAPNSSNNAVSFNMEAGDIDNDTP